MCPKAWKKVERPAAITPSQGVIMQDDQGKPSYNADSDKRTPAQREKQLLDSAHAEGRPDPSDGERPLSSANQENGSTPAEKPEGGFRHILNTGLPPGIDVEDAVDPGTRNLSDRKSTNNRS
jgi:hypothetical protein